MILLGHQRIFCLLSSLFARFARFFSHAELAKWQRLQRFASLSVSREVR